MLNRMPSPLTAFFQVFLADQRLAQVNNHFLQLLVLRRLMIKGREGLALQNLQEQFIVNMRRKGN